MFLRILTYLKIEKRLKLAHFKTRSHVLSFYGTRFAHELVNVSFFVKHFYATFKDVICSFFKQDSCERCFTSMACVDRSRPEEHLAPGRQIIVESISRAHLVHRFHGRISSFCAVCRWSRTHRLLFIRRRFHLLVSQLSNKLTINGDGACGQPTDGLTADVV